MRRHATQLTVGAFFVLITNSIMVFGPRVLGLAIDDLRRAWKAVPDDPQLHSMMWYVGLLMLVSVGQGISRFAQRRLIIGVSRKLERDLRANFFDRLLNLPRSFYNRMHTGDIMSRATQDIENVRRAAGPAFMYSINTLLLSSYALIMMAGISGRLTVVMLLLLPVVSLLVFTLIKRIHRLTMESQRQFGRISSHVQESVSGMRVIQAYTREKAQQEEFESKLREYRRIQLALVRVQALLRPSLVLIFSCGQVLILWMGGNMIIDGSITLGGYVAFIAYMGTLMWPMMALGWSLSLVQRGDAGMKRLNDILRAPENAPTGSVSRSIQGELSFEQVDFRYPGKQELALSRLCITIPAGSSVGIVGPTGCGKSTLLSLLPRLLTPTTGRILLDGIDLQDYEPDELRRQIAVVPQDTFLFSDSLHNNVAFGRPDASRKEVVAAAGLSRLTQDLEQFNDGWESRVGERGISLSGGQKQRTAIARALLQEAPVLLFDDCLSAVDTQTEEAMITALRSHGSRRTMLIAGHRLNVMRGMDLILVLDHGRIVQQGTHEELLTTPGLYADLYQKQQIEAELEGRE